MKANIAIILFLLVCSIAQMNIPLAFDRTLYSYFVYGVTLVGRAMFCFKIFGLPISWKIGPALEGAAYALTMVFFMSAKYKNSFAIIWPGFLADLIIAAVIVIIMVVEELNFVYVEDVVTHEEEGDNTL